MKMSKAKEEVSDWSRTLYALAEEEDRCSDLVKEKTLEILAMQGELSRLLDRQRAMRMAREHMASISMKR